MRPKHVRLGIGVASFQMGLSWFRGECKKVRVIALSTGGDSWSGTGAVVCSGGEKGNVIADTSPARLSIVLQEGVTSRESYDFAVQGRVR